MRIFQTTFSAAAVTACLVLVGCGHHRHADYWGSIDELVAVISPTAGNQCRGVVRFTQTDEGVRITAEIEGLTPNAEHAFHVHDYGDARASDATSTGGHYNPLGHPHGRPTDEKRHAGDLGNLTSDAGGRARYERIDDTITLAGMKNPVIGRGVIIHAGRDQFTQPTGGAGARIGVGVIGIAKPAQ